MKNIIMAAISFTFVFVGASQALAQSDSSKAKLDLQLIEKYKGTELAKKLIERRCKSLPEVSSLCQSSQPMSPAQEDTVEQAVKEDLQQQSVQSSSASVNVSSGDGATQNSTVTAAYPGADCVQQAVTNINKFTSGLAARLNKNINRAAK